MRGLIGDRLFKRFVGDILHQPEPRVLGSGSDNSEAMTIPSETTEEKTQARTPGRGGEATNAPVFENGKKPAADEYAGFSYVREDSMNSNAGKDGDRRRIEHGES
jgi:hypothetical protein